MHLPASVPIPYLTRLLGRSESTIRRWRSRGVPQKQRAEVAAKLAGYPELVARVQARGLIGAARELGVTPATIRRWLKKGLPKRQRAKLQPLTADALLLERAQQVGVQRLALQFRASERTVRRWLSHGVPIARRPQVLTLMQATVPGYSREKLREVWTTQISEYAREARLLYLTRELRKGGLDVPGYVNLLEVHKQRERFMLDNPIWDELKTLARRSAELAKHDLMSRLHRLAEDYPDVDARDIYTAFFSGPGAEGVSTTFNQEAA